MDQDHNRRAIGFVFRKRKSGTKRRGNAERHKQIGGNHPCCQPFRLTVPAKVGSRTAACAELFEYFVSLRSKQSMNEKSPPDLHSGAFDLKPGAPIASVGSAFPKFCGPSRRKLNSVRTISSVQPNKAKKLPISHALYIA